MNDLINRQDAIEAFCEQCTLKGKNICPDPCTELRTIYNLPSAESDPCEDAVSRQAVLDINTQYHGKMPNELNHQIWKDIKALPSAQPETARRIVGKSRNGMTLWYQCEMCYEPVDAQDNFCRGCGRRLTDE